MPISVSHDDASRALTGLLDRVEIITEAMTGALDDQREATRQADPKALGAAVTEVDRLNRELSEVEVERFTLTRLWLGQRPGTTAKTLSELAEQFAGDEAAELIERGEMLRDRVKSLCNQQAALRASTESLVRHLTGISAGVSQRLSGSGTYTPGARVRPAPGGASTLDLVS